MKKEKPHGYKYRLHYLLRQLSVSDFEIARKWFPEVLKVHPDTFKAWIYIKAGAAQEIPGTALMRMAIFFDCKYSELFTDPVDAEEQRESWLQAKVKHLQKC